MAYTPTSDLQIVRHRERELAAAKTRAEVDALEERWSAEDRAWREAADWRTQQVRDLTQRVAQLEKILGPSGKRLAGDLIAGIGEAVGKIRVQDRERLLGEIEKRGFVTYGGVWDESTDYARGAMVTCAGSTWIAVGPVEKGERPGRGASWRLASKGESG